MTETQSDDTSYGKYMGNCKWFNHKIGYGFVTVVTGDKKGKDIFVHHTGVKPKNSNFRTLTKGEYVSLDVEDGKNGLQGINITGVLGGPLMCDNVVFNRNFNGNGREHMDRPEQDGQEQSNQRENFEMNSNSMET
jgi:cold shock CspA family protein|tara:strand:+ start:689 stop:1093 length:405 start_codon:yes stop_codon:yes gene_type:complete